MQPAEFLHCPSWNWQSRIEWKSEREGENVEKLFTKKYARAIRAIRVTHKKMNDDVEVTMAKAASTGS